MSARAIKQNTDHRRVILKDEPTSWQWWRMSEFDAAGVSICPREVNQLWEQLQLESAVPPVMLHDKETTETVES